MPREQSNAPLRAVNTPRVLLLPFYPVNFHDSEHFTDGLLEDLMIALDGGGRVPIVRWTTARYLREKTGDMREYQRVTVPMSFLMAQSAAWEILSIKSH